MQSTGCSNISTTNDCGHIATRVGQLSTQLQNSEITLPIYVRFQTHDQHLTLGVLSVAVNGKEIHVKSDDGRAIFILIESLTDIVGFRDASGNPIFLTDFPLGGDIAASERALVEEYDQNEKLKLENLSIMLDAQSVNGDRNILKGEYPMFDEEIQKDVHITADYKRTMCVTDNDFRGRDLQKCSQFEPNN